MDRIGFIREKRQIKFLILYAMQCLPLPVGEQTILESCLIDDAFGYMEFAEAFSELTESGHVAAEQGEEGKLYRITEKGREASAVFERQLPSSVRDRAMRAAMTAAAALKRDRLVSASHRRDEKGAYEVTLSMGAEEERLFSVILSASNENLCAAMENNFKKRAEKIYSLLLAALMGDEEEASL